MKRLSPKLMSWASQLEPNTLEQAKQTSQMPFIKPYLALMPDAHLGKGSTVGSVIPTVGAIMPAAVGVDIGCGMIAVKTQFTEDDFADRDLSVLRQHIERSVPLSAGHYNTELTETAKERIKELELLADKRVAFYDELSPNWRLQLGTLGSGNHFIEVSLDEDDNVWLFLHSGSRGVGNKIAIHHIKVAQEEMKRNNVSLPDRDLAYLTEGTGEFSEYIEDLNWAQHFALLNREEMMDRVIRDVSWFMGDPSAASPLVEVKELERINCHHNFTKPSYINGQDVWLSRKGAIEATEGKLGLVPGSMGTATYVVEGLGNEDSFCSSPHGAGRNFSRTEARKRFNQVDLQKAMMGIEYRDTDAFIDEIPGAYKDIDQVIADSADLIKVVHTLHQMINVKGD